MGAARLASSQTRSQPGSQPDKAPLCATGGESRRHLGPSPFDSLRLRIIDAQLIQDLRWMSARCARKDSAMRDADNTPDYKLQMLVLERSDARCNLARFYVLSIQATLFGDSALVREWWRIGAHGRRRLDRHADHAAASEALDDWLARKTRRGYRIRAADLAR